MGHVVVIGAGLAGLSVAIACRQLGWSVTVCEQAAVFQETGAGLTVTPSARAGLGVLGIGAAFDAAAEPPALPVLRDWASGEPLPSPDLDAGHLLAVRRIRRADLHALLAERLHRLGGSDLQMNATLQHVEQDALGVSACLADGRRVRADLLLGADGIRSVVRAHVDVEVAPRFTGYVAWRFLLPAETTALLPHGREVSITAGTHATLTCYPVRQGRLLNCVALVRADEWCGEGWTLRGSRDELAAHFADANADVRAIVQSAPSAELFKWALFERPVARRWSRGRVALLGDAAHPVLPFLGSGAGLAVEDAVVLGRALAALPLDDALDRYGRARIARATLIHAASRAQGEAFARMAPAQPAQKSPFFDRTLFDYDPSTVVF